MGEKDHKLCGYLCAVLSLNPPQPSLSPHTRFHLFHDGSAVRFRSDEGVVLFPVDSTPQFGTVTGQCEAPEGGDSPPRGSGKCKAPESGGGSSKKRGRKMVIGMVNGSRSVVHQLHALVAHRCLRMVARLVGVQVGGSGGEARAVLLVDVYVPILLWTGWQIPKSGAIAGSLFRHLSCDWGERNMILSSGEYYGGDQRGDTSLWDLCDCHVLGCKLHCSARNSSKRLFELHEIFKNLPSVVKLAEYNSSRIQPLDNSWRSGIWAVSDDVLLIILSSLEPMDLKKVSATCHHLRSLAALVMPCMKLNLFPHQQAAVEWMLRREQNAGSLPHPLYVSFVTEDGFSFHVNTVSGEIVTGVSPTIEDFHGGMFCDEPGLGKTITSLSLILKTQGTMAEPPHGVQVVWCMHNGDQRCGYYELSGNNITRDNMASGKRITCQSTRRGQLLLDKSICPSNNDSNYLSPHVRSLDPNEQSPTTSIPNTAICDDRCTRKLNLIRRNLNLAYEEASGVSPESEIGKRSTKRKSASKGSNSRKRPGDAAMHFVYNENWVQCDSCRKWRKLEESNVANASTAWFCSMNTNPLYQNCNVAEESWDTHEKVTELPGFCTKGTAGGKEQNVLFFTSVLKENYSLINSGVKKALNWLAKLSQHRISEMETIGLRSPFISTSVLSDGKPHEFLKIFQAFGLVRRVEKGVSRWYYPQALDNLFFDIDALRIALCEPLASVRLYLSRATLIVVPSNLVDHWKTQIYKHVREGQLRVYVWTDQKKPCVHNLAWDYDVVITTFNRLSAEWSPRKKSEMMQVHWLRIILDEGHTLGSSVNLTNKFQMAVSLVASNRWILTGTPAPNTPNSQLSHLQPLLSFLHEEVYGQNQKLWEAGIVRPFEAEMEEGRSRLTHLLHRCMISARKSDLQSIPPCIKKVTYLDFNDQHAKSYNELVVTVRRNILLADWNDPSHVESLLNPKQWKFRSSTIKNVRLSCCVAGHVKVEHAGEDIQETMDILVESGLDPLSVEYALIKYNLIHGGNCQRCKEWCRLPVITPCRHLLCLACVSLNSEKCTFPGCNNLYEMQTPQQLARPENPNPKWPVPKDLIELQPSYKQDNWDSDWQSTSSSKVAYLVQRLKELQKATRDTSYITNESSDAICVEGNLFMTQIRESNELLHEDCSRLSTESSEQPFEKVIIFSQFLEHIHVIEQQLSIAGIKFAGMYSPMHAHSKMKSLAMFQHDGDCMALLMDGSAALGLDLSFVTYVFLMEPIWDRSMEEQVISRAHRMGATRPINVETLAMRGTIEEQMMGFLQDADECRKVMKQEFGNPDREVAARTHRTVHDFAESNYLADISFVSTYSNS